MTGQDVLRNAIAEQLASLEGHKIQPNTDDGALQRRLRAAHDMLDYGKSGEALAHLRHASQLAWHASTANEGMSAQLWDIGRCLTSTITGEGVWFTGSTTKGAMAQEVYVWRGTEGEQLGPFDDGPRHSPTGFAWGYLGSGPAELAYSLLRVGFGHPPEPGDYQRFKEKVVARFSQDQGFVISCERVLAWKDNEQVWV